MVPLQDRFPEALSIVQPVAADPPAIATSTTPSDCRLRVPEAAVTDALAPRLRVVVLVIPKVAAVVKVDKAEALSIVAPLIVTIPPVPLFGVRTMLPVVDPPKVRV